MYKLGWDRGVVGWFTGKISVLANKVIMLGTIDGDSESWLVVVRLVLHRLVGKGSTMLSLLILVDRG